MEHLAKIRALTFWVKVSGEGGGGGGGGHSTLGQNDPLRVK